MATIIQQRRDTSVNWAAANPILAQGELGVDLTEGKFKVGDGVTDWNTLPFMAGGESGGGVDLLPLDNQWTGVNQFQGGLISKGFNQGSTRIGVGAGQTNQGVSALAIGSAAGHLNQGKYSVALGSEAAENDQSDYAVAIGTWAGQEDQGVNSIAMGFGAGRNQQGAGGIIICASGNICEDTTNGHVHISSSQASLDYTAEAGEWTVTDASGTHTLIGADGAKGDKGDDGIQGVKGDTGEDGDTGLTGDTGANGDTGDTGPEGPAGDKGDTGDKGDRGDTGAAGQDGTGTIAQVKLPYANVESDYLVSGIAMGSGDEQNLLDSSVWNFTLEGDLLNQGVGTLDITEDDAFEPDFTGRVRMTCTVVFSSASVPQGYLVVRNNGIDVSGYETFYKTHLDMTGTKLSSEIDIVIDVVAGDSIVPFFGVGSGSCDVHQSYTDILRLDFEASMTDGADGADGDKGDTGADGIAGARWYSGYGSPSSAIGATGDYYLDGTSGNIWTRTPSQWFVSGENIMGPAGADAPDLLPLDNTWTGLNTFNTDATGFGINLFKSPARSTFATPSAAGYICMNGANMNLDVEGGQIVFDSPATMSAGFIAIGTGTFFGNVVTSGTTSVTGLATFGGGLLSAGAGANSFRAGTDAGLTTQGTNAVAIGTSAGNSAQATQTVAVGYEAGKTSQEAYAVAVGRRAGSSAQASEAVAVGNTAGASDQGASAVAIGVAAGSTSQGINAIAIGNRAGQTNQHANSVCISGAGVAQSTSQVGQVILQGNAAALYTSGVDWIHTGSITTSSDIRLKENVEPITDALAKVNSLNGITFSYIKDGNVSTGLIAQEVQAVLPEAVIEIDGEGHLAVAYGNVVGLLVESIKELTARIEQLEKES